MVFCFMSSHTSFFRYNHTLLSRWYGDMKVTVLTWMLGQGERSSTLKILIESYKLYIAHIHKSPCPPDHKFTSQLQIPSVSIFHYLYWLIPRDLNMVQLYQMIQYALITNFTKSHNPRLSSTLCFCLRFSFFLHILLCILISYIFP